MLITSIFTSLLFIFFHKYIVSILKIYDKPDNFRKKHLIPTPITGGILVYLNFLIFILFLNLSNDFNLEFLNIEKNFTIKNLNLLFCFSSLFFFMGLIDDKYTINSTLKFFISLVFVLLFLNLDNSFLISKVQFSIINYTFFLNSFSSILITSLCFLLFINALNMYDGINLQSSTYSLFLIFFLIFNDYYSLLLYIIFIPLVFFIYLNYLGKSFLGDGGTYLISFLLGAIFIKFYNYASVPVDTIVLLMIIPGIDMFRLFFIRIYNGRSPFNADRNHIHHMLIDRFKYNNSIILLNLINLIILFFALYYNYSLLIILLLVIGYFILINKIAK